jgi:branched-chain amino acid transport system permease protein
MKPMNNKTITPFWKIFSSILLLVALVLVPFIFEASYFVHVLIVIGIYAILAYGLDLVLGYCGQFSFSQGAFFGIGAYASALLTLKLGLSFWIALPAAALIASFFGLILGMPSLRLKGHYLAITTIAFQIIINLVLKQWYSLTEGTAGLTDIPRPNPISIPGLTVLHFDSEASFYYLILGLTLLTALFMARIIKSRIGRELVAVREDEVLARTIGIHTTKIKVIAFALSAMLAGVAGSFFAHYMGSLHPASFTIWTSAEVVAMVIIGGRGMFAGPLIGTSLLVLLPEYLRVAEDYKLLLYGMAMVLIITFMPKGVAGTVKEKISDSRIKSA